MGIFDSPKGWREGAEDRGCARVAVTLAVAPVVLAGLVGWALLRYGAEICRGVAFYRGTVRG